MLQEEALQAEAVRHLVHLLPEAVRHRPVRRRAEAHRPVRQHPEEVLLRVLHLRAEAHHRVHRVPAHPQEEAARHRAHHPQEVLHLLRVHLMEAARQGHQAHQMMYHTPELRAPE